MALPRANYAENSESRVRKLSDFLNDLDILSVDLRASARFAKSVPTISIAHELIFSYWQGFPELAVFPVRFWSVEFLKEGFKWLLLALDRSLNLGTSPAKAPKQSQLCWTQQRGFARASSPSTGFMLISAQKGARLIGIEYIVSEKIFITLPDEEKKLWHSHEYEVKSGVLFLPGIPDIAEHAVMSDLCKTYGKVFHFWQFDKGDSLPLGPPQLMMALTADGQLREELAEDVQKQFGVSFKEKREKRADLTGPHRGIDPLANSWQSGKGLRTEVFETS